MDEIIQQVAIGALAASFIAGAGYFKTPNQPFEGLKFAKTVLLGGIVGLVASATGMAPDVITALPAYAGLTVVIENALKAIFRRF